MDSNARRDNIFHKCNKWPFENEFKHANELIDRIRESSSLGNDFAHEKISSPASDLECDNLGNQAENLWKSSLANDGNLRVSLAEVLFRCLRWDYMKAILLAIICRCMSLMILVEAMRRLFVSIDTLYSSIQYMDSASAFEKANHRGKGLGSHNNSENRNLTSTIDLDDFNQRYNDLLICALITYLAYSAFSLLFPVCEYSYRKCGLKCRIIITQLIRRKSLRLNMSTIINQSSSQTALSLITNEVELIETAHRYLVYLLIGPITLILPIAWQALTQESWLPSVLCVPVIFVLIIFQLYLPRIYGTLSKMRTTETDKRLDIINTALNSMKIVKLYAWESQFYRKIADLRSSESRIYKFLDHFPIFDDVSYFCTGKLLSSIVFIGTILKSGQLDGNILLTSTIAFNFFRATAFFFFPISIKSISDTKAACDKIKQFLLLEEYKDQRQELQLNGEGKSQIACENVQISISSTNIGTLNDVFSKERNESCQTGPLGPKTSQKSNLISGLNMVLESGDLVFVAGPVGSGKSSLLLTLLGETYIAGGRLLLTKGIRFAYAPQEACLFPDTFMNNILNGRKLDKERYDLILDVCSLRPDLKQLPDADQTLIGSRGVSLSGGQKARLGLARAIYSCADVYLLDDPLSALDARVAKEIFTDCVCRFLAGKLVVLASHQLIYLQSSNKVVWLERNSEPIFGPTNDLLEHVKLKVMVKRSQMNCNTVQENPRRSQKLSIVHSTENGKNELSLKLGFRCASKPEVEPESETQAYWYFLKLGFRKVEAVIFILILILRAICGSMLEYYYRIWSDNIISVNSESNINWDDMDTYENRRIEYNIKQWLIFVALTLTTTISSVLYLEQFAKRLRRAASRLHNLLIKSLFVAKMSFFDFCHSGELSTKFAGDFSVVDQSVVYLTIEMASHSLEMIMGTIPLLIIQPLLTAGAVAFLSIVSSPIYSRFRNTRFLINLNKNLRSPMYTNLTWAIDEIATIRSESDHLAQTVRQFNLHQNRLTSVSLLIISYECTLSLLVGICQSVMNIMIFYVLFYVYLEELKLSSTGTFLVLLFSLLSSFSYFVHLASIFRGTMMSVHGIKKFAELEPEDERESLEGFRLGSSNETRTPRKWTDGQVNFQSVTMRYFANEKPAIEDMSINIRGGERVGVVGRTGAGKSSIVSALYRLYPFEGRILIDGIDTKSLQLCELRASLGVIPQDPVLFSDSLRKNLDPSDEFTEHELWRALEVVSLKQTILQNFSQGLEQLISEGGRNFSVGERQLICLARAVLRCPKILLIDEATANVDSQTDALIQRTIRACFTASTIITVAHRLRTVLDYDRILVLDSGRVVEFDTVPRLLARKDGVFKEMLRVSRQSTSTSKS